MSKPKQKKLFHLQENSKDSYLQPVEEFEGHQLSGGVLALSPHLKWLATCGADGKLVLRAVGALVCKMLSRVNVLIGL